MIVTYDEADIHVVTGITIYLFFGGPMRFFIFCGVVKVR